ncbi:MULTISPECIES: RluA family pseudouridine synthase [Sphingobacterium]|jgi:tRNA pseudouridine32 synthase/23S rRNA pseudouridine746 synthase|uniref:RluA family pseudouridine synthase n=1 Tax=Sphingobacterium TaxID=28453 RepID=UPI0008A55B04|nr:MULTISPECIES: RluA family pseudouridine synthase [Sphingobacterium]HAF35854.1 RluA family pseudouridine synthase [Sphingobacterium sp.]OFV09906.1 RNA pseudouridine synthase [Sphingobacterium sp. HMSC13C05]QQT45209.1 RluA family pseudouridine synthase [Sphingobacterium multivorum]QQT62153.1 RluA family pseudouridine synthase [Sphingobacterium multivorum]SUJ21887.1 Ribosomal large subunit pseudouridine synthase A [Sphingobacterium multivorum]
MDNNTYFHKFKQDISAIELPTRFTFPFCYEPHPLAVTAAKELQYYIETQEDWTHNFGLDSAMEGLAIGKMFGVLVVRNQHNELGYLAAVSGKLAGSNKHRYFVPPIFDMLEENSFFLNEEVHLNALNRKIERLENSEELADTQRNLDRLKNEWDKSLDELKSKLRTQKKERKETRTKLKVSLSDAEYELLMEDMRSQSLKDKQQLQRFQYDMHLALETESNHLQQLLSTITALKEERKTRSGNLQKQLFEQYNFRNAKGQRKNVVDIFHEFDTITPPAGSGECAAPKLLQYAYENQLTPLALAEFWWGCSPASEIRRHKNYYPACRKKCEPILGYMLQGLVVDPNPMQQETTLDIALPQIYEDEDIIIINKPAEFLSVPGIYVKDSVYNRILQRYPKAGPIIIHRLDMSTSGLLVVAKNKEAHKFIQDQFIQHTIKKTYIALLDGIIEAPSGLIDLPLRVDLDDRPRQMVCYTYGKPAQTKWVKIAIENNQTRVRFYPLTGRTHQLRMHAVHPNGLNTPIVGDDLYGKKANRLHLHAASITFIHPRFKKEMTFEIEPDF